MIFRRKPYIKGILARILLRTAENLATSRNRQPSVPYGNRGRFE